jgi:hypothetical protein
VLEKKGKKVFVAEMKKFVKLVAQAQGKKSKGK